MSDDLDTLEAWSLDQLAKSGFFHQKLHEWGMLIIAEEIEKVEGENLEWDLAALSITQAAWNKVIHRGVRPVTIFSHPSVLNTLAGAVSYYRMLAMVSQKSMIRLGLSTARYEGQKVLPVYPIALALSRHLNQVISHLIELDEVINTRELDLWRGMAAGSQAQGSWQNSKGERIEVLIKGLVQHRLREKGRVARETESLMELADGRVVTFSDEPDIAFSKANRIRSAVEIKGGIDPAGVLERLGAAIKSLRRVRDENPSSVTILLVQGVSMTQKSIQDLEINRDVVTNWFSIEDILKVEKKREEFFDLLDI